MIPEITVIELNDQNDKLYSKIRSASLNGDATLRDILYGLVSLNRDIIKKIDSLEKTK